MIVILGAKLNKRNSPLKKGVTSPEVLELQENKALFRLALTGYILTLVFHSVQ